MPTIPVYLPDWLYWKICIEADKLGVGAGKFLRTLAEDYIKYLEENRKTTTDEGGMI